MSVTITPVDVSTDTFDSMIGKVNSIISALGANVVTTNSSSNGAVTSGNVQLTGYLSANNLAVPGALRGGNNQSSATLPITSNVSIGNSTVNVAITFSGFYSGESFINSTALGVGSNVVVNTSSYSVGNSTVNSVLTSNSLNIDTVNVVTMTIGGVTQNSTFVGVGANAYINSTSFFVGNSVVNAIMNSLGLTFGTSFYGSDQANVGSSSINSTAVASGANVRMETTRFFVGNSTANAFVTSVGLVAGPTTVNSSMVSIGTSVVNSTAVATGANVYSNTTGHYAGNSTVNTAITGPSITTPSLVATNINVTSNAYLSAFKTSQSVSARNTDTQFYTGGIDGWIYPNSVVGTRKSLGLNDEYFIGYMEGSMSQYGSTMRVITYLPFAGTIKNFIHTLEAGVITASVRINGITVTGLSSLTVNTSTQTANASALNTFAIGDYIDIVISGTGSSDKDFGWQLHVEKS